MYYAFICVHIDTAKYDALLTCEVYLTNDLHPCKECGKEMRLAAVGDSEPEIKANIESYIMPHWNALVASLRDAEKRNAAKLASRKLMLPSDYTIASSLINIKGLESN